MLKTLLISIFIVVLSSCGVSQKKEVAQEEDKAAKALLQGIWLDDYSETVLLKVSGDSIYYANVTTAPVFFQIINDTLKTFGAQTNSYPIEKQGEAVFWFYSAMGDMVCLHKSENEADSIAFAPHAEIPVHDEVIKKDSVVIYDHIRYRGYVYINPSMIKVMRPGVSDEGIGVDNIYYDNIIHICVYEGKKSLFAKDIKKQFFEHLIPADFLQWAILSDMDFVGVDSKGYHYRAELCIPDGASCYIIHITVNKEGVLSYELVQ